MELPTAGTALVVQAARDPRAGLIEALAWADRTCPGEKPTLIVPLMRTLHEAGIDRHEVETLCHVKKGAKGGSYGPARVIISFLPIDPHEYSVEQDVPHCVVPQGAMSVPGNSAEQRALDLILPKWLPWIAGTRPEIIGDGAQAWSDTDLPGTLAYADSPELMLIHSRVAGYGGNINASSLNRRDITTALAKLVNRLGAKIPWPQLERWAWENGWGGFAISEFRTMSAKYISEEP